MVRGALAACQLPWGQGLPSDEDVLYLLHTMLARWAAPIHRGRGMRLAAGLPDLRWIALVLGSRTRTDQTLASKQKHGTVLGITNGLQGAGSRQMHCHPTKSFAL